MGSIEFEIPSLKLESLANKREHWRVKANRAKTQRRVACVLAGSHLSEKDVTWNYPINVRIVRVGKRRLDSDNLAISAKHVRDGIADALHVDDGDERVIVWHYAQETGKEYGVRVEIK